MENEETFPAKEMFAKFQEKKLEIERLKTENGRLERLYQDSRSYMNGFAIRLEELRKRSREIEDRLANPRIVEARLDLVWKEMELLKTVVDLYGWPQKTADKIQAAARRISQTAKSIADSAAENVRDSEGEIDEAEKDLRETLSRMEGEKNKAPDKDGP